MDIEVIIPCVQYSDFLSLTLPVTTCLFKSITVVTSLDDHQTYAIAKKFDVRIFRTNHWFKSGASFNKAAALNQYLEILKATGRECWVLFLDADILFAEGIGAALHNLDKNGLYSIRRRLCQTKAEWKEFVDGATCWDSFPLRIPRVVNGKVWSLPTSNPAALCGYLQLWHLHGENGLRVLPECKHAARYDVEFALSFPEASRKYLERHEVLHLGPCRINWRGRVSSQWTFSGNDS